MCCKMFTSSYTFNVCIFLLFLVKKVDKVYKNTTLTNSSNNISEVSSSIKVKNIKDKSPDNDTYKLCRREKNGKEPN
jgi:hypothetical protein